MMLQHYMEAIKKFKCGQEYIHEFDTLILTIGGPFPLL